MAEAGQILGGRYRLRARIEAGGMGEVWWGTDLALRRIVAIKLVRPDHVWDEEGRARFRAECRHAAALAHRNIVRVHDYCEAGPSGLDYLVMEYVNGPSLARLLETYICSALVAPSEADDIARIARSTVLPWLEKLVST